jgi:hypothetical protein
MNKRKLPSLGEMLKEDPYKDLRPNPRQKLLYMHWGGKKEFERKMKILDRLRSGK